MYMPQIYLKYIWIKYIWIQYISDSPYPAILNISEIICLWYISNIYFFLLRELLQNAGFQESPCGVLEAETTISKNFGINNLLPILLIWLATLEIQLQCPSEKAHSNFKHWPGLSRRFEVNRVIRFLQIQLEVLV